VIVGVDQPHNHATLQSLLVAIYVSSFKSRQEWHVLNTFDRN
jgi:hypothetical protein